MRKLTAVGLSILAVATAATGLVFGIADETDASATSVSVLDGVPDHLISRNHGLLLTPVDEMNDLAISQAEAQRIAGGVGTPIEPVAVRFTLLTELSEDVLAVRAPDDIPDVDGVFWAMPLVEAPPFSGDPVTGGYEPPADLVATYHVAFVNAETGQLALVIGGEVREGDRS